MTDGRERRGPARRGLLRGLLALAVVACDETELTRPADLVPAPSLAMIEAGNAHFFFLAPLDEPDANGTFNAGLATDVEVCEWSRAAAGDGDPFTDPCLAVVESFATADIGVSEDDEQYHVNWRIRNTAGIQHGTLYAIRVLASGVPVGSVEIVVGSNGRQAAGYARDLGGNVVPLTANQTLPIKYRAEFGIFCEGECYEVAVTDADGGTFVTEGEDAGAIFPSGALPDGVEDVTLIIEEVELAPGDQCLGGISGLTSTGRCIRFDTEPKLANGFDEDVVVGICFDDSGVPAGVDPENFAIHRFDPDTPGSPVEELPGAAAPFLDCSATVADGGGPLRTYALAGLRSLLRFVGPAPLAARDEGFGGVTSRFSHFQWALPVTIQATSPATQTGAPGQPVPSDPTVRVLTAHNHGSAPQVPVAGQAVTFEFFDVGGTSLGSSTVPTDAGGYASVPWVLTATAGTQSVTAHAFNTTTVVFEATTCQVPAGGWTSNGPDDHCVLDDGSSSGNPSMTYDWDTAQGDTYSERLWHFTTTATADGTVTLPWSYDALHSWYSVNIDLWAVVTDGNGTTTTHLVDFYNQNLTGWQDFSGTVQLNVSAGDTYGFRLGGSNFDSSNILMGTLTITSPSFQPTIN